MIDAESTLHLTSLCAAVSYVHFKTTNLLLDHGASIEAKDNNGWTAINGTIFLSLSLATLVTGLPILQSY